MNLMKKNMLLLSAAIAALSFFDNLKAAKSIQPKAPASKKIHAGDGELEVAELRRNNQIKMLLGQDYNKEIELDRVRAENRKKMLLGEDYSKEIEADLVKSENELKMKINRIRE